MKRRTPLLLTCAVSGLALCLALAGWQSSSAQEEGPGLIAPPPETLDSPGQDEAMEVLASGPVHEAFAEQYNQDPQPGLVVPKEPPQAIEELPPDQMPEGENVAWIPGYWGWDDEREDYIWISGVWRDVPPGQSWIPGYWVAAEGGWQWISGFWSAEEVDEITYMPEPPASLEVGPSIAAPSEEHFWIPGCWIYHETRYVWRPGYWSPAHTDWVWVPARYNWTPRGVVFVNGYWDYRLSHRGTLFSPVYFHPPFWQRPVYRYTPVVVVDMAPLLIHLWVRPHYHHYYFGNFYGSRYAGYGIRPWYLASGPRYYDPLFVFYSTLYGRRTFYDRMHTWHSYYDRHPNYRPPRTWRDQRQFLARHDHDHDHPAVRHATLSRSFDDVVQQRTGKRFVRLGEESRTELVQETRDFREFKSKRSSLEQEDSALSRSFAERSRRDDSPRIGERPDRTAVETAEQPEKAKLPRIRAPRVAQRADRDEQITPADRPESADPGARPREDRPDVADTADPRRDRGDNRGVKREPGERARGRDVPPPASLETPGVAQEAPRIPPTAAQPGRGAPRIGDRAGTEDPKDRPDRVGREPRDTIGQPGSRRPETVEPRVEQPETPRVRPPRTDTGRPDDTPRIPDVGRPDRNPRTPDIGRPDRIPGTPDIKRPTPETPRIRERGPDRTPGQVLPPTQPRTERDIRPRPDQRTTPPVQITPRTDPRSLPRPDAKDLRRENRIESRTQPTPGPRIEVPRQRETRRETIPRIDVPREQPAPRIDFPRPETRREAIPRPQVPQQTAPRIQIPRQETRREPIPRIEIPRQQARPQSRPQAAPRIEIPRQQSRPQFTPRTQAPSVRESRPSRSSAPRIESSRGRQSSGEARGRSSSSGRESRRSKRD